MVSYAPEVRLVNALVSYVLYIGKMFWSLNLAVFYPHPGMWSFWTVAMSLFFLLSISYFSIRLNRKYTYFAVGWLWYLGMLVPVIGLVQVGTHAMADRYTYVPLIGLFIIITWGSVDACKRLFVSPAVIKVIALIIMMIFGIQSYVQTQYWQNALQLFSHAIKVTKDNYIAHNNLGAALARQGNYDEAVNQYREALRIMPQYIEANFNMGAALADQGKFTQAVSYYQRTLEIHPRFAEAHNNLAIVLANEGKLEDAIKHFQMALSIREDYPDARNNLRIAKLQLKNRLKKSDSAG
jgi:protein O-mannosyl-transferase